MSATVERTAGATFSSLVEPMLTSAYRVASGLTRNREDAEDLVQEAVLRAHRGFDSFEPGTNFKAWFFRILFNSFRTQYRRRRGDVVAFDDSVERTLASSPEAGRGSFAEAPDALGRLHVEQIEAALRSLPEEYRLVATMYFVEDLSYEDMANALDIPVGTVRSRLHRGRKMLQARLWSLAVDLGIVRDGARTIRSRPMATAASFAHWG
jgi:RNA polymerase sigma-70 factor (ECF subfamily)